MICHRALRATRDGEVPVTSSYGPNKQMRPLVNCSFRTWKSPFPKSSVQNVHLDSQAGMECSCSDPQRTWIVKFLQRNWLWWCPKHHPQPHPLPPPRHHRGSSCVDRRDGLSWKCFSSYNFVISGFKSMENNVHCSTVYNSQDMEATKMPISI